MSTDWICQLPTAKEKTEDAAAMAEWKAKSVVAQTKLNAAQHELEQTQVKMDAK
ncbi:MAG: hypothetical protein JSR27_01465 [Proteobacteria bacterium]|nr:hypothetical protein [Pseudomonadota bacterium]